MRVWPTTATQTRLGSRALERRRSDQRDRRGRDRLHRRRGADLGATRRRGRARTREAPAHRVRSPITANASCANSKASPRPIRRSRSIRDEFDQDWVQRRVGLWLKNFFDHDFVFVADPARRPRLCAARPQQRRSALVQFDPARACADPRLCARPRRRSSPIAPSASPNPRRADQPDGRPRRAGAAIPRPPGRRRGGARSCRPTGRRRSRRTANRADRAHRQIHRRGRAGRDRRPPAAARICARPAPRRLAPDDHSRSNSPTSAARDRALRLDAEAARRRDRAKRHSVHRGRARGLRAAGRADLRLYATHRRDDRGRANSACAISPCTIRCAVCRTATTSASGCEAVIKEVQRGGALGGRVLHRPRPFQGRQRHARPSGRRRTDPQRHVRACAGHCAARIWWRGSAATNSR